SWLNLLFSLCFAAFAPTSTGTGQCWVGAQGQDNQAVVANMRERIDRFHRVDSAQSLNPALVTEIEEKTSSVKSPEARKTSEKLRNRATGWVQIGPKPVDFRSIHSNPRNPTSMWPAMWPLVGDCFTRNARGFDTHAPRCQRRAGAEVPGPGQVEHLGRQF